MRKVLAGVVIGLLLAAGVSMLPIWPQPEAQRTQAKSVDPVLTGSTLNDQTVSVPDRRPAVLFFFTVACGTCFPGAQQVVKARDRSGEAADYVAVNLDFREPSTVVSKFFAAAGDENFPVLMDRDMSLGTKFRVEQLGTLVVMNPQGRETYRKVDPSAREILRAVRAASAP